MERDYELEDTVTNDLAIFAHLALDAESRPGGQTHYNNWAVTLGLSTKESERKSIYLGGSWNLGHVAYLTLGVHSMEIDIGRPGEKKTEIGGFLAFSGIVSGPNEGLFRWPWMNRQD